MKCPMEVPEGMRLLRRGETSEAGDLIHFEDELYWTACVVSRGLQCWNNEGRVTPYAGGVAWVARLDGGKCHDHT
jgi:hypothetical protein